MKTNDTQKVEQVKGRAMLHWVGKKPLGQIKPYPAQLCEHFNADNPPETLRYETLEKDWHNLLFHGDNKEILSTLLVGGFRGKVDLIYIDPPFDSGADYVRKVKLRGMNQKIKGEDQTPIEQTQYTDIWANDTYLQFMYERLILLRELLSDKGSIYLHCDWHKSHHLRFLMDEVFGENNFINEVVWGYRSGGASKKENLSRKHDIIIFYKKSYLFEINSFKERQYYETNFMGAQQDEEGRFYTDTLLRDVLDGKIHLMESEGVNTLNVQPPLNLSKERTDYPTQKPENLLYLLIKIASTPNSIVLDCFCGSGTTQAVAQELGRRWIGCDMNKGAIQTTSQRLQKLIKTTAKNKEQDLLKDKDNQKHDFQSFLHYRVNNYDFQKQNELESIVYDRYGIDKLKTHRFFDGLQGDKLVKLVPFNKPFSKLDLQLVKDELGKTAEERNVLIICNGSELAVNEDLKQYNKLHPINKITCLDIQKDGIFAFEPARAELKITKQDGKAIITIENYFSPTIMKRLDIDRTIFDEKITDFRSLIDGVLIDIDYNGKTFAICHCDFPAKKNDLIEARYELTLKNKNASIAVKIIDMLGEEILHVQD